VKLTKRSASGDRYLNLISLALGGVSIRPSEVLVGAAVKVDPAVAKAGVPTTLSKSEAKTEPSSSGASEKKESAPAVKTGEWWADVTKK
jgi:hypothetical protein